MLLGMARNDLTIGETIMLSDKAKSFLAKDPTFIGEVKGHKYYEHPTLGDESPLIEITPKGKVRISEFWELPSEYELD